MFVDIITAKHCSEPFSLGWTDILASQQFFHIMGCICDTSLLNPPNLQKAKSENYLEDVPIEVPIQSPMRATTESISFPVVCVCVGVLACLLIYLLSCYRRSAQAVTRRQRPMYVPS